MADGKRKYSPPIRSEQAGPRHQPVISRGPNNSIAIRGEITPVKARNFQPFMGAGPMSLHLRSLRGPLSGCHNLVFFTHGLGSIGISMQPALKFAHLVEINGPGSLKMMVFVFTLSMWKPTSRLLEFGCFFLIIIQATNHTSIFKIPGII